MPDIAYGDLGGFPAIRTKKAGDESFAHISAANQNDLFDHRL
jgi:hypothetical protein